jgi:hypothetical protein
MTRLVHSASGNLRAMQISTAQVFAFVEGGLDRPFVERLLRLFARVDTRVRVAAIKETPGGTGGKPALLKHFRRLKRKGHLLATAWGKPFVSLFFVDKDADDALRKLVRSPHVAYTPAYDLEGSLFTCGDLIQALASTCLVTRAQAEALIGDIATFMSDLSRNWSDWITLCLIAQFKKQNLGCTFDRVSVINTDPLKPPDQSLLQLWKSNVRASLAISENDFDRLYLRFKKVIDSSIESGEPLRYFNGKWLKYVLQKRLETQPRVPDANMSAVAERALSVLVSHVASHANCLCCKHYETLIQNALQQIESQAAA